MKMKKYLAAAAACSMLLAGCSDASSAVTSENAPTDMIRTLASISSESSSEDVLNALEMLISATADAYDYKLEMRNTTETSSPYFTGEGLASMTSVLDQRDIRYADDNGVYELLEQESDGQQIMGLMDANSKTTDTVYASYTEGGFNQSSSTGKIETIETAPNSVELSAEEVAQSAKSMVTYPLYSLIGANLILQPFTLPEYYTFTLNKDGSDYVFDMSIKDHEAYNEYLDNYVVENYGYNRTDLDGSGTYVADTYDTQNVDIALTIDENGVIKKIINNNFNAITTGEETIKAYTKQTCLLGAAPEGTGPFFTDFFKQIADKSLTEGDSFTLNLSNNIETVDEETAGAPAAEESAETADSENKDSEDNADAADENKSEEAADSSSEGDQKESDDKAAADDQKTDEEKAD